MAKQSLARELLKEVGFYKRSFILFFILAVVVFSFLKVYGNPLSAEEPASDLTTNNTNALYDLDLTLNSNGNLYSGNAKLNAENFTTSNTYRIRYQVAKGLAESLDKLTIAVHLPKPGTDQTVSHQFIQNDGTTSVTSELVDPQTVVYTAVGISKNAILTIELEVPKDFVTRSLLANLREKAAAMPIIFWSSISVALPLLTLLLLFGVTLSKIKKNSVPKDKVLTEAPADLRPALLEILIKGRLTSRGLAATFIDLARRGHLIITQYELTNYRFRRHVSSDKLQPFEQELLDQLFGPMGDKVDSEEINLSLSAEIFSQRVSRAFSLAYEQMQELGYYYSNPLALHHKYLLTSIGTFTLGIAGFFANLLLFPDIKYSLFFWIAMIIASFMIGAYSKDLPSRTFLGRQELDKWLSFANYLTENEPIPYSAYSRDRYLAYLPFSIVFDVEVEWTKRFYNLPFAIPSWYNTSGVNTIDEFTNKIFPMFGYLSYTLSLSVQPSTR